MNKLFGSTRRTFTGGTPRGLVPGDMWVKCDGCHELVFHKHLQRNWMVCPRCGYHFRLAAVEWLSLLLDRGSFQELERALEPIDALDFCSLDDSYKERLRRVHQQTGLVESLICGSGTIRGRSVEIAVANFSFMGGSMGSVYGEKVTRTAERAAARRVPLVTINTSGGARMQEGILALMQMAKVSVALTQLARARQLHISVLVDPCYGGVSASYASAADIVLAESGAHIGFAGPRVVAQTIQQALPPDFQTAEFLLKHGMIDEVVPRSLLQRALGRLLAIHAPVSDIV